MQRSDSFFALLLVGAVTLPIGVASIAAAQAGTSTSTATLLDNNFKPNSCFSQSGPAPTTSASCPPHALFSGGNGSLSTTSDNAGRTATATAQIDQPLAGSLHAIGTAASNQYSALTVTGTPAAGDQLVFHLVTSQAASGIGGTPSAYAFWAAFVVSGSNESSVHQVATADGAVEAITFDHAQQTATGFDLFLPFTPGSTFDYFLRAFAEAASNGLQPKGAAVSSTITATLRGVDALTSQGDYIASATFDSHTGLGAIDLSATTTVPEPASLTLLATGLLGVVVAARRRFC